MFAADRVTGEVREIARVDPANDPEGTRQFLRPVMSQGYGIWIDYDSQVGEKTLRGKSVFSPLPSEVITPEGGWGKAIDDHAIAYLARTAGRYDLFLAVIRPGGGPPAAPNGGPPPGRGGPPP
jgi:hypothetical protein